MAILKLNIQKGMTLKKQSMILAMLITALSVGHSETPSYKPKAGYVPNSETAIKVAEDAKKAADDFLKQRQRDGENVWHALTHW